MSNFQIKSSDQRGFTLIEMVVAVFAFSIVLALIGTVFVYALTSQRRIINAQKVEENLSFVMESMTREIRVAQPDAQGVFSTLSDACTSASPAFASTLDFLNSSGQRIVYSLSGNAVHRSVNGTDSIMNSNSVEFTRLQFCVSGVTVYGKQPRITILTSVRSKDTTPQVVEDYQTTVALRYLGI